MAPKLVWVKFLPNSLCVRYKSKEIPRAKFYTRVLRLKIREISLLARRVYTLLIYQNVVAPWLQTAELTTNAIYSVN